MYRLIGVVLLCQLATYALAQTVSPPLATSDPTAISLAQKSVAALTGGAAVSDVTLNANVISIVGSNNETGTGTFRAKGNAESRVDLSSSGGTRSSVRSASNGLPTGSWTNDEGSSPVSYAQHNCWTDASWFFPALSSLALTADQNVVFKYIGQELHRGVNTQHIQVFHVSTSFLPVQRLSSMDFYIDPLSFLPLAIVFNVHPDENMYVDLSNEVLFANYQPVSGIQIPFHFQQMFSGSLIVDVTITNVSINTGLLDTSFQLP